MPPAIVPTGVAAPVDRSSLCSTELPGAGQLERGVRRAGRLRDVEARVVRGVDAERADVEQGAGVRRHRRTADRALGEQAVGARVDVVERRAGRAVERVRVVGGHDARVTGVEVPVEPERVAAVRAEAEVQVLLLDDADGVRDGVEAEAEVAGEADAERPTTGVTLTAVALNCPAAAAGVST